MLIRKAFFYSLGELFNRVGKILFLFVLARIQKQYDFGLYNYYIAIVGILVIFLDCGLNTFIFLRVKKIGFGRIFSLFLSAKFTTITIVSILFYLYIILNYSISKDLNSNFLFDNSYLILALAVLWDLTAFLANTFRAKFDFYTDALIKVISNIAPLILIILFAGLGYEINFKLAILFQIFGFLLAATLGFIKIMKDDFKYKNISKRKILSLLFPGFILTLSSSSAILMSSIDSLLLGFYSKIEYLASFSIAFKLALIAYVPLGVVLGFLSPSFVNHFRKRGTSNFIGTLEISLIASILIAMAISQIYLLGINFFSNFIFLSKYHELGNISSLMSLIIMPIYLHTILWTLLSSNKKFIFAAQYPAGFASLIIALFDFVSIKYFNYRWVSWSPFIANIIMLIGMIFVFKSKFRFNPLSAIVSFYFFLCLLTSFFLTQINVELVTIRLLISLSSILLSVFYLSRLNIKLKI